MIRILEINAVPYGSTCKIMLGIAKAAAEQGMYVVTASGYSTHPIKELPVNHYAIGGVITKCFHMQMTKLTGYHGLFSYIATRKLINYIQKDDFDIIHLHNVHGWYLNFPVLFDYLRRENKKVIWTLHDCWTFTGQCPHFTMIKCEKWKTGCFECQQGNIYPKTLIDRSQEMYALKKKWFTGLDAVLVTPSQWLARIVSQSFMKNYPVQVIYNGVSLDIFYPRLSDFRKQFGDKKIILGVSLGWSKGKGLDVFVDMARSMSAREYQIILVGGDEKTDLILPTEIVSIHRTQNQSELAEIYSAADVLVNPTREEVLGMVNIEALACGTPVVTFNTGGCPECIDKTCGYVIDHDNRDALFDAVIKVCTEHPFSSEACRHRAEKFSDNVRYKEYLELYQKVASVKS